MRSFFVQSVQGAVYHSARLRFGSENPPSPSGPGRHLQKILAEKAMAAAAQRPAPDKELKPDTDIKWRLPGGLPTIQAEMNAGGARINHYVDRHGSSFIDGLSEPGSIRGKTYMALLLADQSIADADKVKFIDGIKNPDVINLRLGSMDYEKDLSGNRQFMDRTLMELSDSRDVVMALCRLAARKRDFSEAEKDDFVMIGKNSNGAKSNRVLKFVRHFVKPKNAANVLKPETYHRFINDRRLKLSPSTHRSFIQIPPLVSDRREPFLLALMDVASRMDSKNPYQRPPVQLLRLIKQNPQMHRHAAITINQAHKYYQGQGYGTIPAANLTQFKKALQKA